MYSKFIFLLCNFFLNNRIILKFKCSKFKTLNYNYDFLNVTFENFEDLKKILLSKNIFPNFSMIIKVIIIIHLHGFMLQKKSGVQKLYHSLNNI